MVRADSWQVKLIQVLAIPGLLLSFYLWLFHEGSLIAVCGNGGWDDCGVVSGPDAPYSAIGPIPVAVIGFLGYAAIFLVIWLSDWVPILEDYLPETLVGFTGIAVIFTLYLTALEAFFIHAFCRYCLVSAGIVILMFVLAISFLRSVSESAEAADTVNARVG